MSKAVYPGTFDPVTLGHVDVIERAAAIFDQLIIGVGDNPAKKALFTRRERLAMVRRETAHLPNVQVAGFRGLLVDFAAEQNVAVILRGVRTVSDFEYELQMAAANRAGAGVETVFMTPTPGHQFVSARLIKELAAMGGDVSKLVAPSVEKRLRAKFARKGGRP